MSPIFHVYTLLWEITLTSVLFHKNMRLDHHVRSLHYFHAYAALNHVKTLHLDDTKPIGNVEHIPLSKVLLSPEDCSTLRDNYVILISRILVQHLSFLQTFKKCVPQHIQHVYSQNNEAKIDCGKSNMCGRYM